MEIMLDGLILAGDALLAMALNPFYYIGLLLIVLLYRRQTELERKLFFMRLHSMPGALWRAFLWGLSGGLLVSLSTAGFGLVLSFEALLWIWAITAILLLIRVRYACFAYAAGVVALLQVSVKPFERLRTVEGVGPVVDSLLAIHLPSLFALVALLYVIEALLVRMQGADIATPLYVEGKRGKVIGAYELQGLWVLPLFVVVPAGSGTGMQMGSLPWPMFFGGDIWHAGWTLLAFPVMIGYSEMLVSALPQHKLKSIAGSLLAFAVLIGALAVLSELRPSVVILVVTAVLSIAAHEGLMLYADRRERSRSPVFIQEGPGLKVLDVRPGSAAAEMGIARGEIIVRANGCKIATKEQLHAALRMNSAFCKLEIVNLAGHNRFAHRALFDGEHHQLGLVLCPDDQAVHYAEWRAPGLVALLRAARKRKAPAVAASAAPKASAASEVSAASTEQPEE